VITVRTEFSEYEVDPAARRIRRVRSDHAPTPNQGGGGWRGYARLDRAGGALLVTWSVRAELRDIGAPGETASLEVRRTLTSDVAWATGDDAGDDEALRALGFDPGPPPVS